MQPANVRREAQGCVRGLAEEPGGRGRGRGWLGAGSSATFLSQERVVFQGAWPGRSSWPSAGEDGPRAARCSGGGRACSARAALCLFPEGLSHFNEGDEGEWCGQAEHRHGALQHHLPLAEGEKEDLPNTHRDKKKV